MCLVYTDLSYFGGSHRILLLTSIDKASIVTGIPTVGEPVAKALRSDQSVLDVSCPRDSALASPSIVPGPASIAANMLIH
jgi:hypothetical protein